tara:strand:+ start:168 stop:521 length:354 start_codon:yes stop_codon:yes gene_type:complete
MSKIEEAIEDIINAHLSSMDFSDMITTEVRECWDMDDLDRIDDMDDRLENVESWISDSEDKAYNDSHLRVVSPQTIINLENSIKNLCENVNDLKLRLVELEEQASKSFFQKLMFWRS